VTSYPALKILTAGGKDDYAGAMTFKGLYDELNKRVPDGVRILSGDGEGGLQAWNAFKPRCSLKLCVVLVSSKQGTSVFVLCDCACLLTAAVWLQSRH
jgi:hypothetical protein